MEDHSTEILSVVREIRGLIRLMAEPAVAARDKKFREELRKIVGNSKPRANAVLLMNGTRLQADIRRESGMQQGNLSTLVKRLAESKLLSGDAKMPKLTISIPANFFEGAVNDE